MGFSRQDYWSGLPFPSLGNLPDPGIEPRVSRIAGGLFNLWATRETREYHIWWATFRGFICFLEGDWCRYNEYNWGHGELSKHSCPIVVGSKHEGYLIKRHRYSGGWCAGGDELWEWLLTSIWIHDFPHLYSRKVKSAPMYIFKVDFLALLIIKDRFLHQDSICVETDCCLSGQNVLMRNIILLYSLCYSLFRSSYFINSRKLKAFKKILHLIQYS